MRLLSTAVLLTWAASHVSAQYPAAPSSLTYITSKVNAEVTLSFKETEICPQPPGSKAYSGFVHLPGSVLANVGGYDINSYFLYFEARNNPSSAPLAIWLAGGPGESSTYSALSSESGPCYVDPSGQGIIYNPWSFNQNVNVLYVDQPVQAGFSYNHLVNATSNLLNSNVQPLDGSALPLSNGTFGYGTFSSQRFDQTANTTVGAAKALWHFAEHWLSSFPGYQTSSGKISVWGNSYGGYWAPETATLFSKNFNTLPPNHPLESYNLSIDAMGITNGCVNFETEISGFPQFAYNNTYGVRFASEKEYNEALHYIKKPGGCLDLIKECQRSGEAGDPDFSEKNATVNRACEKAFNLCNEKAANSFPKMNKRNDMDIAQTSPQACPFYLPTNTYLNNASIQQSLGVPLNFSVVSNVIETNFGFQTPYQRPASQQTGDLARQNGLSRLEYLLANNIKIAFIFGDRDYACPWTGGQATALAAKWPHQADFAAAGFTEIEGVTKKGLDHGGVVKQYDHLSFSRLLDVGHDTSAYAPETVFRIFERTLRGVDVATGEVRIGGGYHSTGPAESWEWRNTFSRHTPETCVVEGEFTEENPWDAVSGG